MSPHWKLVNSDHSCSTSLKKKKKKKDAVASSKFLWTMPPIDRRVLRNTWQNSRNHSVLHPLIRKGTLFVFFTVTIWNLEKCSDTILKEMSIFLQPNSNKIKCKWQVRNNYFCIKPQNMIFFVYFTDVIPVKSFMLMPVQLTCKWICEWAHSRIKYLKVSEYYAQWKIVFKKLFISILMGCGLQQCAHFSTLIGLYR